MITSDKIIEKIKDGGKPVISAMPANELAAYICNYQAKTQLPVSSLVIIFNDITGQKLGFSDYDKIIELANTYQVSNDSDYPDWMNYKIPMDFYFYMQPYWTKKWLELKQSYKPDYLDLAMLAVEHGRENRYKKSWASYIVSEFLDISHQEAKTIIDEATELLDEGETTKTTKGFSQLLAIKHASYINKVCIETWALRFDIKSFKEQHERHQKSALKKIKTAATKAQKQGSEKLAVNLSIDEALSFSQSIEDYEKREKKRIEKALEDYLK